MKKMLFISALLALTTTLSANDTVVLNLIIQDGKFIPSEFKVPANKRIEIMIDNKGPGAEEFESHDLKREKVIPAGKQAKITVNPLKKGTYKFFGEFHEATAQGKLIVE
jgi:plastocyanin